MESIEKKLDKSGNRIKDFDRIVENYIRQYYENEDKIKRREIINLFKECVAPEAINLGVESVKSCAISYSEKKQEMEKQENKIASFRAALISLHVKVKNELDETEEQIKSLEESYQAVVYEKYSYEVFKYEEEKKTLNENREKLLRKKDDLDEILQELDRKLNIINCKKEYLRYKSEKVSYDNKEADLKIARMNREDKEPRREELGRILGTYYSEQKSEVCLEIENADEEYKNIINCITDTDKLILENRTRRDTEFEKKSECNNSIRNYDEKEQSFNEKYKEEIARNIFGEYEAGHLDIEIEKCKAKKIDVSNELKRDSDRSEEVAKISRDDTKRLSEAMVALATNNKDIEALQSEINELDLELSERERIMSYIDKINAFDTEGIIAALRTKEEEISVSLRHLQDERKQLTEEKAALLQGRLYDLPASVREAIEGVGVEPMYGFSWLLNNGKSEKNNLEIVRKNPILPYAIIVTAEELKRLHSISEEVYNNIPVPVILRSDVEASIGSIEGGMVEFDSVRLILHFDEALLNKSEYKNILEMKGKQISDYDERIEIRKKEISDYNDWIGIIKGQKVTRKLYEDKKREYEVKLNEKLCLTDDIENLKKELEELKNESSSLQECIDKLRELSRFYQEKETSLISLSSDYDVYLNSKKRKRLIEDELLLINSEYEELSESRVECEKRKEDNIKKKSDLDNKLKSITTICNQYEMHLNDEDVISVSETDRKNIGSYEAEYQALTQKMDSDILRLEREVKNAQDRLAKANEEYKRIRRKTSKRLNIDEDELDSEIRSNDYNTDDEDEFLEEKQRKDGEKKYLENEISESNTKIAVIKTDIKHLIDGMKKECHQESLMAYEDIVPREYEAELKKLSFKKNKEMLKRKSLVEKSHEYDALLSGLSEYDHFEVKEDILFEREPSLMTKEELDKLKGDCIRRYNSIKDEMAKLSSKLSKCIRDIMDREEFNEDYFHKPLVLMQELVDDPENVLRQIDITIRSYEDLMEKLMVDLSVIDKERSNIVSLLLEHIKRIHNELDKIDSNSTIRIRERDIKMLDIRIPEWKDNEELYNLRIHEYMDRLTTNGLELLKQNENLPEYLGTRLNTKTLYDEIVGISNIQIKLYKVEEQREYPISWSDVARNSGGEGFLSTFVILSSLLHYIRKDENDLFARNNESKVMVMDNPFGITYSEHLLKPLMQVAKKNNTQLICLSGLSGDSIYSRFDNIYVLNLVAANLKSGQQFLRTDHLRGNEPEDIVPSKFEVVEQMTLF